MRQIVREWRVVFGDLPVWEMMKRRWIAQPEDLSDIAQIRDDLRRFFGLETDGDFTEFLRDNILPSDNPLQRVIDGATAPQ